MYKISGTVDKIAFTGEFVLDGITREDVEVLLKKAMSNKSCFWLVDDTGKSIYIDFGSAKVVEFQFSQI